MTKKELQEELKEEKEKREALELMISELRSYVTSNKYNTPNELIPNEIGVFYNYVNPKDILSRTNGNEYIQHYQEALRDDEWKEQEKKRIEDNWKATI